MAQPHLVLRLLAASLAFSFALAQTRIAQVGTRGVNIARPGVSFPVSGRRPAGSGYAVTSPGTYAAPAGFEPPVDATVARAVLDAIEVRDPAVDASTRTVEARPGDDPVSVLIRCPAGQYAVVTWAPLYQFASGDVVPGGEKFEVWFVQSNIPGTEGVLSGEYSVDCFD